MVHQTHIFTPEYVRYGIEQTCCLYLNYQTILNTTTNYIYKQHDKSI